jgi:adenylate kinase family enzyme
MTIHKIPNFLIVGTMKSGTSTLADYLAKNVDIHIPKKEVHYFNNDKNYNKGLSWYHDKLTEGIAKEQDLNNLIIGEKTPTYSYQANCVDRIKETIPEVKLIWIFRNPVKRSFSNYVHAVIKGSEYLPFDECVSKEEKLMQNNIFRGYVERSKYSDQVERFLEKFTLKDMHFLLFEDLINNPEEELNKISAFLDVAPFDQINPVHSNKTTPPKLISKFGRKLGGLDGIVYKTLSRINLDFAHKLFLDKMTLSDQTYEELSKKFKPYNERLARLTGLNVDIWDKTMS